MTGGKDLRVLLKRVMELVQPDLRKYYRVPRKGQVVASYPSDGAWYADVQPLRNDESPDMAEPVLPRLELPVLWGGPSRGVVCPPRPGTRCAIGYWDGDPSYPYIAEIRWSGQGAPDCGLDEFIVQLEPGVHLKIDAGKRILAVTTADGLCQAGGAWRVQAPLIELVGNLVCRGLDGGAASTTESCNRTQTGSMVLNGPLTVNGPLIVNGDASVSGNSHASSRSGGPI